MDVEELPLGELGPEDPEYADLETPTEEDAAERKRVVLKIFAPKHPDPKRFRFLWDESVGEAAKHVADKFGYAEGTPSFQTHDGTVLDRTLTLKAAGVRNRQELELVDAGGGV
jgi:hypothetical protein